MKTIWKYPLAVTDVQTVVMPSDAQLLDVQVQRGEVCLWALVDTKAPKVERRFVIYGTGHPINPQRLEHVGTVQTDGGFLVWHVFEITE